MTDDLVLALPLGARALVVSDIHLGEEPFEASAAAARELALAIRAWTGPGLVVVAGGLLACEPTPAGATAALKTHADLRDALSGFAGGTGRRVVVLPGGSDAWLSLSAIGRDVLSAAIGAECAAALNLEIQTTGGARKVRVEPGPPAAEAPTKLPLIKARAGTWLDGLHDLDDTEASSRFVASRLVYRQFGRHAWLLLLPVIVALALRLPVAFLHPARRVVGVLFATALGAAALELALLLGLAALSVRQIWLAFSGQSAQPADLNLDARSRARELAAQGITGAVVGGTRRAELSRVGQGFFAAPGGCGDVTSEYLCRLSVVGLPSSFLSARRTGWVEIEAGNDVHARLLYDSALLPGATWLERLLARRPPPTKRARAAMPVPAVRAIYPNGPYWPPVVAAVPPHRRTRRVASFLVAVAGILSLASAFSGPVAARLGTLRHYSPLAVPKAAGALTALAGLGLVMLARGIRRGQRRAFLVCEAVLVAVVVLNFLRSGRPPAGIVALAAAVMLWVRRRSFQAASDLPPVRGGLARLGSVALLGVVLGTVGLETSSWFSRKLHHFRGAGIGWGKALLATVERLAAITSIPLPERLDDFFTFAMAAFGTGLVAVAAWMVFRPVVAHRARGSESLGLARAREAVANYGGGTLDYFALRSDKQFFFWGSTVVAYAVYGGTCLVSPDPIGPPAQREAAWRHFREHVDARAWSLAVLGAGEDWLPIYRASGMHDLYVGDEAVVKVKEFSLEGGKFKGLRQAVKRVARYGYTISFHDPSRAPAHLVEEMQRVMTKSRRGGVERGFSMTLGRIFDPSDEGLLVAVVHGPPREGGSPGPVVAFCQYVPAPAINGFSLDLMRRDNGEHPNGLIDFAIVETIRRLAEQGYEGLGLNFATMRAVLAGESGDGLAQRVQTWMLKRMSGPMQIESLWRFNAKFDPIWQPRYAVYDSPEHALAAALAVARAESFWELPVIGRFLVPSAQRQMEAASSVSSSSVSSSQS